MTIVFGIRVGQPAEPTAATRPIPRFAGQDDSPEDRFIRGTTQAHRLLAERMQGLAEEREVASPQDLLTSIIREEGAEKRPRRRLLNVAAKELLQHIEDEAAQQVARQPEAFFAERAVPLPGQSRETAINALKERWRQKHAAALSLATLEDFRIEGSQPPDELMDSLLARLEDPESTPTLLRGKRVPSRYAGPVFDPAWETRYIQAVLPLHWELDYPIDLLEHHALDDEVGQIAQPHLIRLLNEPAFEWEFSHEGGAVEALGQLGRLVRAIQRNEGWESHPFYATVRDKILALAEAGGQAGGLIAPPGPASKLPGEEIAKLLMETWLDQWPEGDTMPDDLIVPIAARGEAYEEIPEPAREQLPEVKPRPVWKEDPPPQAKKRRRGPLEILIDFIFRQ